MDYNILHLFYEHGKTSKEDSGESQRVTKEMTAPWEETALPTILARDQPKDIFNVNKFGLFYEALASKSLHFLGKYCSGRRSSQVRLTGMTASDAFREKFSMFCIGKSVSARCSKNVPNRNRIFRFCCKWYSLFK